MNRLEHILAYAENHRFAASGIAVALIAAIAWADAMLPDITVGYLYLVPILFAGAALNRVQILLMALLCAYLREAADPLQQNAFDPLRWAPGSFGRLAVIAAGFTMSGFFVAELNRRRNLLLSHLKQQEEQARLREESEVQVRILIETSPLAILTLNRDARIVLANESARQVLGFEDRQIQGESVSPYLPLLGRMLHSHHSGSNIRTNVECRGQRRNGEVFLAHVWLSTYRSSQGPGLAAVIWDASENVRDREGAGLDSMMATSRVLIGAVSHEIRNLATAATAAYSALPRTTPASAVLTGNEQFRALGVLIEGLERLASSGLRLASNREAAVADLGTVLDEARIVIEPGMREAGIRVIWEVQDGLPLVQADHHGLLQVFVNLARNSTRALAECAVREVRISAAVENDLVVVRFRDTGPGIAHPEELFRPFQSGAQSVGLGLYVSRAIVRAHGGGLRYESQPAGACFAVELWPVENTVEG